MTQATCAWTIQRVPGYTAAVRACGKPAKHTRVVTTSGAARQEINIAVCGIHANQIDGNTRKGDLHRNTIAAVTR